MSKSLEELSPKMQALVQEFLSRLKEEGIECQILWTYRTKLEQARLYAAGRTEEAFTSFTRNRPGESFHNFGMAIDLVPISHGRIDLGNRGLFEKIAGIGQEFGLVWGGTFTPPEPQHFQMPDVTLAELKTGKKRIKNAGVLEGMIDGLYAD